METGLRKAVSAGLGGQLMLRPMRAAKFGKNQGRGTKKLSSVDLKFTLNRGSCVSATTLASGVRVVVFSYGPPHTLPLYMPYRFLEPAFAWMRKAGQGVWCAETRTITRSGEGTLLRHRNVNPPRMSISLLSASSVTAE